MKYQHIFFDLDGTLTDSADGIVNSVRYALEKQGIVPPAREQLLPFVVLPQLSVFAFLYYRKYSIINISKDMREAVKCQVHTVHYV